MNKKVDTNKLEWIHKPKRYLIKGDKLILETDRYTDLTGKNLGAEAIELSIRPDGNFKFTVRVDFDFQGRFDQCGILLYEGDRKFLVCGTKHHNDEVDALECIVFHNKYGDRSSREIGTAIRRLYYRIWYRSGDVRVQYSFNGKMFIDVRQFRLERVEKPIRIGIFACSPSDSSFDCTFSEMEMDEEGKEEIK